MKTLLTKTFLTVVATVIVVTVICFVACDIIEEPYRKKIIPPPPDSTKPKILLEKFTGHQCINCPEATRLATQIESLDPENFITVSIHWGWNARTNSTGKYSYDFRTTVGNDLGGSSYGLQGVPNGVINRTRYNGDLVLGPGHWAGAVSSFRENNTVAEVKIELAANYNSTTRQISAEVLLNYLAPQTLTNRVSVWILEDSIINWQTDRTATPSDVENYVHNDVLRHSFNGGGLNGSGTGDIVSDTVIPNNFTFTQTYNFTLPPENDWKPKNLKIVAFVYDDENGVLQAERVKVTVVE